jgi:hypothetical protein
MVGRATTESLFCGSRTAKWRKVACHAQSALSLRIALTSHLAKLSRPFAPTMVYGVMLILDHSIPNKAASITPGSLQLTSQCQERRISPILLPQT